jgi:hypothetical protein
MSRLSLEVLIKKKTFKNVLVLIYLISLVFIFTFLSPNWFTTNTDTIDPWIYWGAGDNPKLSYLNGFANTYYLQRYVIIIPQIFFQSLFGAYWSQLALWIIINNHFTFLFIASLLIVDRTVMGMFGVSYSQAPSLAFILASLATFISGLESSEKAIGNYWKSNVLFFVSGVFAGCLANAYLPIASIFIPTFVLSVILNDVSQHLQIRHRILKQLTFLFGIVFSSLVFQIAFMSISQSQNVLLLQQINLGRSLINNKNPWGEDNGLNGFLLKITNTLLFHWWLGVFLFLLTCIWMFFYFNWMNLSMKMRLLIFYSFLSTVVFLVSHFSYTWFLGYSWTALLLVVPQITGVLLFLNLNQISRVNSKAIALAAFTYLSLGISFNQKIMSGSQLQAITRLALFVSGILFFVIILGKMRSNSLVAALKMLNVAFFVSLIFCLIALRSTYLAFAGDLTGAGPSAKKIYTEVSIQRSLLMNLVNETQGQYRIWLTPDNSQPLTSSLLYSYSLISPILGEASCTQVEWASSSKAIVGTFIREQELSEIEQKYLAKCGFRLEMMTAKTNLHTYAETIDFKFGILKRID